MSPYVPKFFPTREPVGSSRVSLWRVLRGDNGANKNLYGKDVSAQDIVFNKAEPAPDSAKELLATLEKASPVNKSKN
jgi:hypothetical protein